MGSFRFGFSCDIYTEIVCKGEYLEFWFKQKFISYIAIP